MTQRGSTPSAERTCAHCGARLVRRDGEKNHRYVSRSYCDIQCSAAARRGRPSGQTPWNRRDDLDLSELRTRYDAGERLEQIAASLGVSVQTVRRRMLADGRGMRATGTPPGRPAHNRTPVSESTRVIIVSEYAAGRGARSIANRLGLTREVVRRVLTDCGVAPHRSGLRGLSDLRGPCNSHPLYSTYTQMKARCYAKGNPSFKFYGGRGVTVCARWLEGGTRGFWHFVDDMGERPAGHTLDRVDPRGNYEPGNCRWADRLTQARNQRAHVGALYVCDRCGYEGRVT